MANISYTSSGEALTHETIMRRYSQSLLKKHGGRTSFGLCSACQERRAVHNDHTIPKARCKHIHKAELIYDPDNYEDSCDICHKQWESYQSGEWLLHHNCERRLAFVKKHDPEGYEKRINLTELTLLKKINEEN